MKVSRPAASAAASRLAPLLVLILVACGGEVDLPDARLSVAESLGRGGGDLEGYARATEVRPFQFPEDHGPHPDFRTEWWYFTGNLAGEDGRRFGYQLTFFRTALAPPAAAGPDSDGNDATGTGTADGSAWRTRQVYMAHLAVTDAAGERFHAAERFSRGAAGLAGAEAGEGGGRFRVWVEDWSAAETGDVDGAGIFPLRLRAAGSAMAIDLMLGAGDGWVAQGDRGLSRKGEGAGASYYYSFPRMPTRGALTLEGETFTVEGSSWLDREWSTSLLAPGVAGWDWFALQLDDGREVIAFRLRRQGAGVEAEAAPLDYAALIPEPAAGAPGRGGAGGAVPQLSKRTLDASAAGLTVTGRWTSPESGVTWPSGWRLVFPNAALPDADLDLTLEPILEAQELNLSFRYWEGAVRVTGSAAGKPVTGWGYVELTGYGDVAGHLR